VLTEHGPGQRFAGGVAGDRDEAVAQLGLDRAQVRLAAGDANHGAAGGGERGGDGTAEPAAGSGDDGGLVGYGHRALLADEQGEKLCPYEDRAQPGNPSRRRIFLWQRPAGSGEDSGALHAAKPRPLSVPVPVSGGLEP
jgi:hypothetical protein